MLELKVLISDVDVHPLHAHDVKFNANQIRLPFVWRTRKHAIFKIPIHADYIK